MQFLIRSLGVLIKFFIVRMAVSLGLSVVSFAGYAIAVNWLADVVANEFWHCLMIFCRYC